MTAFPDLQVILDDVFVKVDRVEYHWRLTGTNTGPGGTGCSVHIRGFESWQIGERTHCVLATAVRYKSRNRKKRDRSIHEVELIGRVSLL
jgi:hypothetical protein